jgi:transcriptional regulator with XRE-family HTH domain
MEAAVRIGERLRRLREERGWTQAELARKVDASQPTIAGIESGSQLPGTGLLGRLADLFRIDLDYL